MYRIKIEWVQKAEKFGGVLVVQNYYDWKKISKML